MSFERGHHLDSMSAFDAGMPGMAAGKRTPSERLPPQPGASDVAPRSLASSPAPEVPDAFDFGYARPLAATDQAVAAEVQRHLDAGERNVNAITDQVFFRVHPELAGKKLAAGSEHAKTWIWLRDTFVAPAVRSAPEPTAAEAPARIAADAPEAKPASAPVAAARTAPAPVAVPAPAPAPPTKQGNAGGADVYRTQNDNLYMAGGTCNMTSLTMALLSFADGDEMLVKRKAGEALRAVDKPLGGIKVAGKREDLRHALDTPDLLAQIQVEDLLTTLAGLKGLKVTSGATILAIAQATGLVGEGKAGVTGYLKDAKTRARAAEMLASGQQVILGVQGGPGHYVFLTEVLDDGVVVHDPAGCRCQYEAPYFLPTAQATAYWLKSMVRSLGRAGWAEAAQRRLSQNPAMLGVVERLLAARRLDGKAQSAAIQELATGGPLAMGERNFYGLADIARYQMDIRVEMRGA